MYSFELLCLPTFIMLLNIFGSREGAARGVAESKAVLSLQHDIEGDGSYLASERLQRLDPALEDESEDVWPAQVF